MLVSMPYQDGQNKSIPVGILDSYAYQHRQSNKDRIMNAHSPQPSVLLSHMVRDIGAPRLISHAAARRDADHRRLISVQLSTPFLVVALIATVALGAAGVAIGSPPTSKTQAQMVGVFTGEYVNGAPVYRLPPVTVVASRKVERAKLEREKQLTRTEQARAKAAARRPV